jgi:mRNA-degrading endonuclease toxin of MazEF toxin-antitoxin module
MTAALHPGDVVRALFPGARTTKPRPAVVVSTDSYNGRRPDVILALLTTQTPRTITPFDYWLQDWAAAGLHQPSLLRLYIAMAVQASVKFIGHLTDRDWQEVQARLRLGLAVT